MSRSSGHRAGIARARVCVLLLVPSSAAAPVVGGVHVPRRTWWISGLFAVGSICFALGALPAYLDAVSARADGLTFFIGSIFFTCAST